MLTRNHSISIDGEVNGSLNEKLKPSHGENWQSPDISMTSGSSKDSEVIYRQTHVSLMKQPMRPSYMPQATRRQRRASLTEIGFGKLQTYTKLEIIGEGTYAIVYKGQSSITHKPVALKEIRLEHNEGAPCTAIREISLLKDLKHANIVTLHDIIHTEKSLTLVFEYIEQTLAEYLDKCRGMMSMTNIQLFLFQLLRGLAYCHARQVLHRDVKPPNILISEAGDLKLADFGLARIKSVPTKNYTNEIGTIWYRPPELLLGSTDYSVDVDMWDVGCIFFEMACGRPMFPGSSVEEELMLIWKILGTPTEKTWPGISKNAEFIRGNYPLFEAEPLSLHAPRLDPDALDLLEKLLQLQSKNRIPAAEAMRHQYFQSIGPRVHLLPNTVSIFTLPECKHVPNPGQRTAQMSLAWNGTTPETLPQSWTHHCEIYAPGMESHQLYGRQKSI